MSNTNTHRASSSRGAVDVLRRWRRPLAGLVLTVVLASAAYTTYEQAALAQHRAEQQACRNNIFESSLGSRSQATDDLINALLRANDQLRRSPDNPDSVTAAREQLERDLTAVRDSRAQAGRLQDSEAQCDRES